MKTRFWQKGQSLVEIALVLPMFLIIIAGVVEVSNLLITKNRVESAARAAARFSAAGGSEPDVVVLNTVTQTLDLSSGVWDIWLVEATVNNDGDDFTTWSVESIYGDHQTVLYTETQAYVDCEEPEECLQTRVLVELQTDENGVHQDPEANPNVERIAANLQVVGVLVIHDVNSILGLEAMPGLSGWNSVQAFAMMRVTNPFEANAGNGCSAFPIAVYYGNRSLTDSAGGNPYPTNFDYPDDNPPTYNSFYRNVPQVPLAEAQEGYIYLVQDGAGFGNVGWLAWNIEINPSDQTLVDSLSWPGNSTDYADHGDGGQPATPLYSHVVRGYVNPRDNLDLAMHIGDWVATTTGSHVSGPVRSQLENHIDLNGRQLRLIVWDEADGTGSNNIYHIKGFIIAKLHGYHLSQSGGDSWILVEFIRWDNSCGQPGAG